MHTERVLKTLDVVVLLLFWTCILVSHQFHLTLVMVCGEWVSVVSFATLLEDERVQKFQ
jgi:hypothetical protein